MALYALDWFSHNGMECSRVKAHNATFPKHTHDEYVLSANLSGIEEITLNGQTQQVNAGQITLYNPASIQSSRFDQHGAEFLSIHIPQTLLKTFNLSQNLSSHREAPVLAEGVFTHQALFNAICRYAQLTQHHDSEEEEQALLLLCAELFSEKVTRDAVVDKDLDRIIAFMRQHVNMKLTLNALVQVAGISKYALVRRFTAYTGLPPLQYHMQLRLCAARALLRQNQHPLDAAHRLGFYDQSHFINAFRKVMGTTPKHYASQVGSGKQKFFIT
ncbi:AraC family transcriptional regulator [Pantoea sp. SGAir0180]|uniref:helix-turn-helix domain-containing protein n=1 Tax=Pantoea stewartii TaxID=66269 RepID=UPI0024BECA86|nr:AraC family transcriptional regulator [Pantoea stewartii]WHS98739.1 MAG: HTH-type transcriptional activator RhaR [Pantoea stewartii]